MSLVGAAGEALASMIGRINEINHLMNGIASAAAEQSQGITEVNTAVSQMDQITQKNAAMVEETSAETQRLKDEAFERAAKLKRFRIDAQKTEAARLSAEPRKLSPAAQAAIGRTAASFVRQAAARVGGGAAVAFKSEPVHDNGWEEF